ncbi:Cation/H(+) antiporter [Quillaja saponaria]|uniref:Cation/H(+) antiporter n=1 Tax=Quillaja saponaria TaxID=32244 RepID=A0AAD7M2R4_QUISA|nr:Cation/H(+) antiporter [Quillaja saponaria]
MDDNWAQRTNTCYTVNAFNSNGIWIGDYSLKETLPILATQLAFILFFTRLLFYVLKPFHQPRFVAEILAGLILSPSVMGNTSKFRELFPLKSVMHIETIAHVGLIYHVFLTGLEMNVETILRAGKKATSIAVAGILIPTAVGVALFFLLDYHENVENDRTTGYMFWAVALTVTGFPVLAQILADLKLLHTELGRTALTSAMVSDMCSWVLVAILMPLGINKEKAIYSVVLTGLFMVLCFYLLRPSIVRLIEHMTKKDYLNDYHLSFVLVGVLAFAYVTDLLGTHSIIGAFVFGLIMPNGLFGDFLVERLDGIVSGTLLPLFFAGCGIRVEFKSILGVHWPWVLLVILLACMAKIVSTVIATYFFNIPIGHGMAVGVLMNTKGILAFIILSAAWDKRILNNQYFSVMVMSILIMTVMVSPIINAMYKPRNRSEQYKLRTIQRLRQDAELRILACIHTSRNATGIINLLEASNLTKTSTLSVFALHLVELGRRASAILVVHKDRNARNPGTQNPTKVQAESDNIITAFEAFSKGNKDVTVQHLTAVSPYGTIHEDICNLAEEKHIALILLPFHEESTQDGNLEETNSAYKGINLNVTLNAPCSVAIFVDRGLGSLAQRNGHFIMLFIGGPDDWEALAYAQRIAAHPGIKLSVVQLLLVEDAEEVRAVEIGESQGVMSTIFDAEKQKQLDDEYINAFRLKVVNGESITYTQKVVRRGEEIVEILTTLDKNEYDLYIVGQGQGRASPLMLRLLEWSDSPELGVIGDILASKSFSSHSSVLILQQYASGGVVVRASSVGSQSEVSGFSQA